MNRARRELDRMSAEAWRELGDDVQRTGGRLKRVGSAYAKKHPIIVLGGGALLAAVAAWRLVRPSRVVVAGGGGFKKLRGIAWKLLRVGGVGLAHAFSMASGPAEKPGAGNSNGGPPE